MFDSTFFRTLGELSTAAERQQQEKTIDGNVGGG